jgi:hypothetical protein
MSLLAYMGLLVVPFLSAPRALRVIIGSRALALVPGLPLMTGTALLLLTLLTAAFLPLCGWLPGHPGTTFWFGPKIFIIASLYAGLMQVLLTSRYMMLGFSLVPFLVLLVIGSFKDALLRLAASNSGISLLALLTLALWLCALWILARKRNFKPAHVGTETGYEQGVNMERIPALLGLKNDSSRSPAGSLLFAYPASLSLRLFNIANMVLISPLVSVLMLQLMNLVGASEMPISGMQMFLGMSLFTGCVGCWVYGETGARARLLWLRLAGDRTRVWEKLEQELWINFLLKGALTVLLAAVIAATGALAPVLLLHYPLIIFACSLYDTYLNLCARLYQWSSLTQALVMVASIGATVAAIVYGLWLADVGVVLLLELCLLLSSALFRMVAKQRFNRVDWQVLRHAISKRAQSMS